MDLETAIETLQELIDRIVPVCLSTNETAGDPFRVTQIDYLAKREYRCVVVRVNSEGILHHLRRPVADITCNPLHFEADVTIDKTPPDDVRAAVERYAFDSVGA